MPISPRLVLPCLFAGLVVMAACGADDPASPSPGEIAIDAEPDSLAAPWTLLGPGGYEVTGTGDVTLEDLRVGDYTIAWGELTGWDRPDTAHASLDDGGSVIFTGHYQRAAAGSPDEVMHFSLSAYDDGDLGFYDHLLGDDFLFIAQDATVDDRATEMAIAAAMFGGEAGEGGVAISDIAVNQLVPLSVWTQTPANDPHFGGFADSQYRQYDVDFSFFIAGQNLIYRVQGPVLFYVLDDSPTESPPRYELLGVVDATYGNKATENHSWNAVRSLFD